MSMNAVVASAFRRTIVRLKPDATTAVLIGVMLCVSLPASIGAHDIGTSQAIATFSNDRSFTIDISVDPEAILTKLEVGTGRDPSGPLPDTERRVRILALKDALLDRIALRFGQERVRPGADLILPPQPTQASTLRLTGTAPDGATTFQWSSELILGSYPLIVRRTVGDQTIEWLDGRQVSQPVDVFRAGAAARAQIAIEYLRLGITRTLDRGLDHVLFLVVMFLLATRWRGMPQQIVAFVIANSMTLGLTMYGAIALPAHIVQLLMAVSVAYVALENLITPDQKRWRVGLVFVFGLLHGMGFASVLRQLPMPRAEFFTALLTFNAGVELAQVSFIVAGMFLLAHWRRQGDLYRQWVVAPASLMIALVGVLLAVQRL